MIKRSILLKNKPQRAEQPHLLDKTNLGPIRINKSELEKCVLQQIQHVCEYNMYVNLKLLPEKNEISNFLIFANITPILGSQIILFSLEICYMDITMTIIIILTSCEQGTELVYPNL